MIDRRVAQELTNIPNRATEVVEILRRGEDGLYQGPAGCSLPVIWVTIPTGPTPKKVSGKSSPRNDSGFPVGEIAFAISKTLTSHSTNDESENSPETSQKKLFADRFAFQFDKDVPNCPRCGSWETARFPNPKIPAQYACVSCNNVFTGLEGAHSTNSTHQRDDSDDNPDDLTPYVRYAPHPTEQAPELTHIDEPVPDDARFASPIYLLTDREVARHDDLDDPYAAKGSGSIAKQLQDECEARNDVRYPIYVESDDLDTDGVTYEAARDAIVAFIREVVGIDPDDCRWFYSGSRSIHAHVPILVSSGSDLDELRNKGRQFNAEAGHAADIDAAIYIRKRQFRLPGVEHDTMGGVKTPIDYRADDLTQEMMNAMTSDDGTKPDVFRDVLDDTFSSVLSTTTVEERGKEKEDISIYVRAHNARPRGKRLSDLKETPLIERETKPTADHELQRWKQFNRSPFDPTRTNGRRSVSIVTVEGGPYCRESNGQREVLVPAYVSQAITGPGDGTYAITDENCPIRLSSMDIDWSYESGDTLVIIGYPGSTSTVIIEASDIDLWPMHAHIHRTPAIALSNTFRTAPGTDARMAVIAFLELYDVTIPSVDETATQRTQTPADGGTVDYSSEVLTPAAQLQEKAEKGSIHSMSHQERLDLANRLLSVRGWSGAIDWYRNQFGSDYDHDITVNHLRSVAKKYYPGMETPK